MQQSAAPYPGKTLHSFPGLRVTLCPYGAGHQVPTKVPMSAINQGKPRLGRDSFLVSAQILPAGLVQVAQVGRRPIFSWVDLIQWHSWKKQKENKTKPRGFSSFIECGSNSNVREVHGDKVYHFSLIKTRHYSDKFSQMQAVFPKITLHFISICFCIFIIIFFNTRFKTLYMIEVRLMIYTFKMVSSPAQDPT